ncbi:MAG: DUF72 domain-containing protein [Ignavibacteriae bacterium]|nr:DUF72 domain-containing protein [Ignavibacteriota bacterium]
MQTPKLYVGTAGWSYKDWVPNFYPFDQSKDISWLTYYSRYFNMVEVNSTYYTYLALEILTCFPKRDPVGQKEKKYGKG